MSKQTKIYYFLIVFSVLLIILPDLWIKSHFTINIKIGMTILIGTLFSAIYKLLNQK